MIVYTQMQNDALESSVSSALLRTSFTHDPCSKYPDYLSDDQNPVLTRSRSWFYVTFVPVMVEQSSPNMTAEQYSARARTCAQGTMPSSELGLG
jgi:hypothetical protein